MKIGQLMAAANNQHIEFNPLITSIKPLPLKQVLPVIESSLGCSWKKVFKSIDESRAAASLGQVHHAVLKNGEEVAVKAQYPDIQQAINSEMTLLGMMPEAGPVKQWHFDLDAYRHALKENMDRELDYRCEAKTQALFLQEVELPLLVVPKIVEKLCSEKLLVQSWETGVFLEQAANWPQQDREQIAKTLLSLLLTSLFKTRRLHADPHMGNSYFRYHAEHGVEMVLMDYGCTIDLTEQQSLSLLKLIISTREKLSIQPLRYFAAMGFDIEKLSHIEQRLPMLCSYLFAPFLEDKKFILQQWQLGEKITNLLTDERWWFRSAGPAKLVFIMRAFQGVVQQLECLKVNLNWGEVLLEVLPDELLDKARAYQCPAVHTSEKVVALASLLKVKVVKQGITKAEVDLPAEAVLDLEQFIPEEIQLKLNQSSEIDLKKIIDKVRQSGIAVQPVFEYEDDSGQFHVWLE